MNFVIYLKNKDNLNMTNDIVKTGKDLLPGDIIRTKGELYSLHIIISIDKHLNFHEQEHNMEYYCVQDGFTESMIGALDYKEEFNVIQNRKEILHYYDIAELELLRKSADVIDFRREIIGVKDLLIDRLNSDSD